MIQNFALHQIYSDTFFEFNPDDYSRFKFGDDAIARNYGYDLAEAFVANHPQSWSENDQIVVIPSPYSFVPTPSHALSRHFLFAYNRWLAQQNRAVAEMSKVHRTVTYKEDYGSLDAAERIRLIGNDTFHIDTLAIEGKKLIFIDDVRITGSHERMIKRMVEQYGLKNDIVMLYFAQLTNPDVHPRVENTLNYHFVKKVFDIEKIISEGTFVFNTRVIKYILNAPEADFQRFIERQKEDFVHLLFDMALGNSYHLMDAYQNNFKYLTQKIPQFSLLKEVY